MKILITNDDSVSAPQLLPLIKNCRAFAEVTVVVPKFEQSAKSHSIQIHNAFEAKKTELEPGIPIWVIDSTPADCVRFAVSGLKLHFDLVISGINRGYNLGKDTMYSGTLAAATEAATKGMKAIALSSSMKYYDRAVEHLTSIFHFFQNHRLLDQNDLYNVNIPVDPKGFRITRLGDESFSEEFIPTEENVYFPGGKPIRASGADLSKDTDACALGYISITPMVTDRTNWAVFQNLQI